MSSDQIPYVPTTFRIVPAKDAAGNPGWKAVWALTGRHKAGIWGTKPDATPVRQTRQAVILSMATLYGDCVEYGKESHGNG